MRHQKASAILALFVTLELLELHGPDGQTAWVNAQGITALRAPTTADLARHFPKGTRCVVTLVDAKFIAVVETCATVREMLVEVHQQ